MEISKKKDELKNIEKLKKKISEKLKENEWKNWKNKQMEKYRKIDKTYKIMKYGWQKS